MSTPIADQIRIQPKTQVGPAHETSGRTRLECGIADTGLFPGHWVLTISALRPNGSLLTQIAFWEREGALQMLEMAWKQVRDLWPPDAPKIPKG